MCLSRQRSCSTKLYVRETADDLMKKFGLIGHPIAHSLSPSLFKAGYDGRYTYDLIEEESFEAAYSRFINEYDGINVTAPFKEQAFARADSVSDECRAIGAANILIKTPEGIRAYNSDYLGVRMWIQEVSGNDPSMTVLVVGAGGAGKAAAAAAASLGLKTTIINRTMARAAEWAERQGIYEYIIRPVEDFAEEFRRNDIVIYTLPVALPQICGLDRGEIEAKKALLEANYKDPVLRGNGKIWLLYQAVTGYELFTGEKPNLRQMSDVL